MSKVFLRVEKEGASVCSSDNGDRCYYNNKVCPRTASILFCALTNTVYIQDTIIPQKLALYEEMRKMIIRLHKWLPTNACSDEMESIIDRAKKIEEATQ